MSDEMLGKVPSASLPPEPQVSFEKTSKSQSKNKELDKQGRVALNSLQDANISRDNTMPVVGRKVVIESASTQTLSKLDLILMKVKLFRYLYSDEKNKLYTEYLNKQKEDRKNFLHSQIAPLSKRFNQGEAILPNHAQFNYEAFEGQSSKCLSINNSLLLDESEFGKPIFSHREMAEYAVGTEAHQEAPPVVIPSVGTMLAFQVNGGKEVNDLTLESGAIYPTSFIKGKPELKNHLLNAYVIEVESSDGSSKRVVIRSGVINTEQRANEFQAILLSAYDQLRTNSGNPEFKMRVVSHQLNSPEVENAMIEDQHYQLARIQQHLKLKNPNIELVHINTPSNRWFSYTKSGENTSREQNLDSWGKYVQWFATDLSRDVENMPATGNPNVDGPLKEIRLLETDPGDQFLNINDLVVRMGEARMAVKNAKSEVAKCRSELKTGFWQIERYQALKQANSRLKMAERTLKMATKALQDERAQQKLALERTYHNLIKLETHLPGNENLSPEQIALILRKTALMRMVLGSQLSIPDADLERGMAGMAMLMLNEELGVSGALNCKSGLDRTGLWHAIKLAMEAMRTKIGPEREWNLIKEWDKTTTTMNRMIGILGKERFVNWMEGRGEAADDLKLEQAGIDINQLKEKMQDVHEFRKLILTNLIRIGLPITLRSTGLAGLKWNSGWSENLMPLNFLPSYVHVSDAQGNEKAEWIVNYNKTTGLPHGISNVGRRLLTLFSGLRGS